MNLIKKTVLSVIALLTLSLFSLNANAQTVKFAHIDYLKVVDSIPSMLIADKEIKGFLDAGEKTIAEMEKAFEEAYNQYLLDKPTLSTVMVELREKQLMEQQQMIDYKRQS